MQWIYVMYSTKKQYVMFLFVIEMHEQWTKKILREALYRSILYRSVLLKRMKSEQYKNIYSNW